MYPKLVLKEEGYKPLHYHCTPVHRVPCPAPALRFCPIGMLHFYKTKLNSLCWGRFGIMGHILKYFPHSDTIKEFECDSLLFYIELFDTCRLTLLYIVCNLNGTGLPQMAASPGPIPTTQMI